MQDWDFFTKNFDNVSNELIADGNLLRLDIHILAPRYLKKNKPRFIKVTENNNEELDQDAKEELIVSNLEEEAIKKRALYKEKRDAQAALLAMTCPPGCLPMHELLSPSSSIMPGFFAPSTSVVLVPRFFAPPAFAVPGLSTPLASTVSMPDLSAPFMLAVPVPGLSTLSTSPVPIPGLFASFPSVTLVLGLSTPSTSAIPVSKSSALSAFAVPVPGLFTLSASVVAMLGSSALSLSAVPVLDLSAPSAFPMPMLVSSSPFLIWLSPQITTPVPKKQRLGQ